LAYNLDVSEQDFYLAIRNQAEGKFSLLYELGHRAQTEGAVARFGNGQVTPLLRALAKKSKQTIQIQEARTLTGYCTRLILSKLNNVGPKLSYHNYFRL
jgi:hypothetical protein